MTATTLYRLFDADDGLLYVGIADQWVRRLTQHSKTKPWWSEVAKITAEHFPTRDLALTTEAQVIGREHPTFNLNLTPGRASCTLEGVSHGGVIDRLDRVHNGQVAPYIESLRSNGYSHRQIADALSEQYGIYVDRTTVLRFIKRQAAA